MTADKLENWLKEKLKSVFGFEQFRGEQETIILHAIAGHSSLVLMPTGQGKSLCYLLPALYFSGEGRLVLVISPLVALMQDQVQKAREFGIAATFINSSLSKQEREERQERIKKGEYQILFVTPERFRKPEFIETLSQRKITLMAIDEAHCISQWGHDFRPDYSRLGDIRQSLNNPPVMALTATATPEVQKDILKQMNLTEETDVFQGGIERPNLHLNVHSVYGLDEKIRALVGLTHNVDGAQIIYSSLISTLQKVSGELRRMGISHLIYHGDLPSDVKQKSQKQFIVQEKPLILATPAFGLGIDKPNVRTVIHVETPLTLEAYFQEIGRAGRDGKPAQAHLLYDRDDISIQMDFLKWSNPDPGFIHSVFNLIKSNRLKLEQDGIEFLKRQMNFYNSRDFRVETTLNQLERWGCLEKSESKFGFEVVREPSREELDKDLFKLRMDNSNKKLLAMVRWAERENEGCRLQEIYEYFGHKAESCGQCDLCIISAQAVKE
jgi:ATP-dependent DNA helicase RecQ